MPYTNIVDFCEEKHGSRRKRKGIVGKIQKYTD